MSAMKFFAENINLLPMGLDGSQADQEKHSLYSGLLEMAKQLDAIQDAQRQQLRQLQNLSARIR
ncbi:hypothetical protein ACFJGW_15345 [Burkholderiaceae bacterium UC74_6]